MKTKIKPKQGVKNDFMQLLENENWIEILAEVHLEAWHSRYANYGGNKRRLVDDLYINHDPSIEIENTEEELKRKLNDAEYDYLIALFNEKVIELWKKGYR